MNKKFEKRKKIFFRWLKNFLIVYILIGVALYFLQDKILLHPVALFFNYTFQFKTPFEERLVHYDSSTLFDIIRFKPASDSAKKGAVIYCHGNMENMNHYAMFANNFTKQGY